MRPHRRFAAFAGLVCAAAALSGCTSSGPGDPIPPDASASASASTAQMGEMDPWRPSGSPVTLADGLKAPWSVVPLPSGGALISERNNGSIIELTPDGEQRMAGVVPDVVPGGESGLHGLALWEGDGQRWLYAYHGAAEDNRVVRMPLQGAMGALRLGESETVITGIPRNSTHDGGRIAFGPDGLLYVTTGDAQIRDAAQDPDALGGKILRLTPEGDPAPGNPFDNEVWSLGHRNVQGIAWTADGEMWASEFGQDTWDELNHILPGGNYGWPIVEGEGGDDRFVDPVTVWPTSEASPSGIAVAGSTVFLAALRGERLWKVDVSPSGTVGEPTVGLEGQGRLRDVVAAPNGTLWILTNNTDGRGSARTGDDILISLPIEQGE